MFRMGESGSDMRPEKKKGDWKRHLWKTKNRMCCGAKGGPRSGAGAAKSRIISLADVGHIPICKFWNFALYTQIEGSRSRFILPDQEPHKIDTASQHCCQAQKEPETE
jgi:hypothetical protein